jgi:hypothetical protein
VSVHGTAIVVIWDERYGVAAGHAIKMTARQASAVPVRPRPPARAGSTCPATVRPPLTPEPGTARRTFARRRLMGTPLTPGSRLSGQRCGHYAKAQLTVTDRWRGNNHDT